MRKNDDIIAIYSRKSKFTGKGESIGNQVELCKEYVRVHYGDTAVDKVAVYEEMKIANLIQFESLNTQEIGRNKGLLTYSTMSEAFIFLQSSMRKKIRGFKC